MNKYRALTLVELLIAMALIALLVGASAYVFRVILVTWSSQETRVGVDVAVKRGFEQLVRDIRGAKEVSVVNSNELRFTTADGTASYIYYFYNSNDHYPSAFNQASYELRKAALTGGVGGSFSYGSGNLVLSNVVPPATSNLSFSNNLAVIDLSALVRGESIRYRTLIRPRNI